MKKRLVVLAAMILAAMLLCLGAFAEEDLPEFTIEGDVLVKYNGNGGVVTVPDGIADIAASAFESSYVTKVILPNTVKHLGSYCFLSCRELEEIILPASVENIEKTKDGMGGQAQVFGDNEKLTKIGVDSGNTHYKEIDGVLYTIDGKKLVYYPAGKNRGAAYTVPDGTEEIGYSSTSGAEIISVTLPASLCKRVDNELSTIRSLKEITVADGNTTYYAKDGVLYSGDELSTYPCSKELTRLDKDYFPAGLKSLQSWAFQMDNNLVEVELPEGLERIGWMCFDYARSLETVTTPASLQEISGFAFTDCYQLKSVTFLSPDVKFETTGNNVFSGCANVVVYGYEGSTAQEYAEKNGIAFSSIGPIPAQDIGSATISEIKDQVYTGKALKPAVTVEMDGKTLSAGTDYTIFYKNNKKVGQATVIITGKGSYEGTKKATFRIIPKAVKLSSLKPGAKKLTVIWEKGSGIDGYEIEYSLKSSFAGAKTVNVKVGKTSCDIKKLKAKKKYYVRIRTWKKVSGEKYYSAWSKAMNKKTK